MRFCAIALPALSSFLLFHGVPWQDPQGRRSGDALAERAREEFREHKYQAAERDFRAITRRDPSNVYAQLFLGQCLFAQQKYVDASTSFEEARELEEQVFRDWPSFGEPWLAADSLPVDESLAEALGITAEEAREKMDARRQQLNAGQE